MLCTCYVYVVYMLFTSCLHVVYMLVKFCAVHMLFTCCVQCFYMFTHVSRIVYPLFAWRAHVVGTCCVCRTNVVYAPFTRWLNQLRARAAYMLFTCCLHAVYLLLTNCLHSGYMLVTFCAVYMLFTCCLFGVCNAVCSLMLVT